MFLQAMKDWCMDEAVPAKTFDFLWMILDKDRNGKVCIYVCMRIYIYIYKRMYMHVHIRIECSCALHIRGHNKYIVLRIHARMYLHALVRYHLMLSRMKG